MSSKRKLTYLAILVHLGCYVQSSLAAEAHPTSPQASQDTIERMIVTGTFSGKAIRKDEASFSISTFSTEDMQKMSPKSTADLFKNIPGVWAESSGGVSGANVFVRGFPSGGDAPFLTVQLQGAPIYQPPTLSFLENSTLFRLDETVEFMEALRGGPNPVISNGQPGLTTNFLLKEGGEDAEGIVKYSTSDYGLQRIDAVVSGSLAEELYFMMGGYLKSSPGVRDAGFNAEEGKQFTLNLTQNLDKGKINLYTRQTDDHGVWYLPAPLNIDTVDNEYTQIGTNNRQAVIQYGPNNTSETFDFGNGRGWNGSVTGGSIDLSFDNGWGLVDRFIYTEGDADTYGLVPNGDPTRLSNVALNGDTATGSVTSREYAGSTMVQQIGRWVVKKQIEAFTNDFILTKTFEDVSVTAGFYHSTFNAKDWWALGNQAYHVVESGGERLTGIDCNDNQDSCDWNYDINSIGEGTTQALYSAISYKVADSLTLDVGIRGEDHQIEYTVDEGLDTKITKAVSYDESSTAWTVGANWMFADHMGVFARINDGNKMPYFDDFRDNFTAYEQGDNLIKEVSQYELGFKLVDTHYELFATLFMNEVKGDTFVPQPGDPVQVFTNEAYGIEIDLNYFNNNGLSVSLNSTIQETEITDSPLNNGNEAQRQPGWQVRMTPSYDIELNKGMYATLYLTLSAVGERYANNENSVVLAGYEKVDLGVLFNFTEAVQVQLAVSNLTNEAGLTEGDPRDSLSSNGRYILPRTIDLSLSYEF